MPSVRDLSKPEEKRRALARGAIDRMEQLAYQGDENFPSIVETLWAMLNDQEVLVSEKLDREGNVKETSERPRVDAKQKVAIANTFLRVLALKEQALESLGLSSSGPKKVENHTHFTQINLSLEDLEKLPQELREKLQAEQLRLAREAAGA